MLSERARPARRSVLSERAGAPPNGRRGLANLFPGTLRGPGGRPPGGLALEEGGGAAVVVGGGGVFTVVVGGGGGVAEVVGGGGVFTVVVGGGGVVTVVVGGGGGGRPEPVAVVRTVGPGGVRASVAVGAVRSVVSVSWKSAGFAGELVAPFGFDVAFSCDDEPRALHPASDARQKPPRTTSRAGFIMAVIHTLTERGPRKSTARAARPCPRFRQRVA